jgi:hypothetical protein
LPHGLYHNRLPRADNKHLAAEAFVDKRLENFSDVDPVDGHPEHQVAGPTAFAGDETEILERFGKECSQMLLAVGNAGPRHHLAMPEPGMTRGLVKLDVAHVSPQ